MKKLAMFLMLFSLTVFSVGCDQGGADKGKGTDTTTETGGDADKGGEDTGSDADKAGEADKDGGADAGGDESGTE